MRAFRCSAALLLVFILLTQTACPKRDNLVNYAGQIVDAFSDTLPLLQQAGVSTSKLLTATNIATQLVTAFKNHQDEDAVHLASSLITAFEGIASDVSLIGNQTMRTRILVTLAVAQIALRYIAANISAPMQASSRAKAATPLANIRVYAQKRNWRCRSSVTGRFERMDVCRQSPATTTVERY